MSMTGRVPSGRARCSCAGVDDVDRRCTPCPVGSGGRGAADDHHVVELDARGRRGPRRSAPCPMPTSTVAPSTRFSESAPCNPAGASGRPGSGLWRRPGTSTPSATATTEIGCRQPVDGQSPDRHGRLAPARARPGLGQHRSGDDEAALRRGDAVTVGGLAEGALEGAVQGRPDPDEVDRSRRAVGQPRVPAPALAWSTAGRELVTVPPARPSGVGVEALVDAHARADTGAGPDGLGTTGPRANGVGHEPRAVERTRPADAAHGRSRARPGPGTSPGTVVDAVTLAGRSCGDAGRARRGGPTPALQQRRVPTALAARREPCDRRRPYRATIVAGHTR